MTASFALIQGSLSPKSKTAVVLEKFASLLLHAGYQVKIFDLRTIDIPFCDGREFNAYPPHILQMHEELLQYNFFVFGTPVYQYSLSGAMKNFLDIFSDCFEGKLFSVIANSGGIRSYLATRDLMNILSYEVRGVPIQPFIHTYSEDFDPQKNLTNTMVEKKMQDLIAQFERFLPLFDKKPEVV